MSTTERQTDAPQLSHPTPTETAAACVPDPETAALRAKLEAQLPTLDVEGLCSIAPEERTLIRGSARAAERLVELVRDASPEGLHNPFIEGRSLRSTWPSCGLMTLLEEQLYYDTPENDALATAATEAAPPALQLIGARYLIRNDGDREVARRLWEALSESAVSGAALAEFELRAALDWTNSLPVRTPPLSLCERP